MRAYAECSRRLRGNAAQLAAVLKVDSQELFTEAKNSLSGSKYSPEDKLHDFVVMRQDFSMFSNYVSDILTLKIALIKMRNQLTGAS